MNGSSDATAATAATGVTAATSRPGRGMRARKKHATRQALERCTVQLWAERGLDHVTADDIAEAAGVSTRTFFNYFASKEDAAFGAAKEDHPGDGHEADDPVLRMIRAQPADMPPLEAMRTVMCAVADEMVADKELWRLRFELVHEHPALLGRMVGALAAKERRLAQAIAERIGTDELRDTYSSLVAAAGLATLRSSLLRWIQRDSAESLAEIIDEAFDALASGLAPPGRR